MSFSKKFCAKSPFKKSQADEVLVEGAKDAVEEVEEHGLEKTAKGVSMLGNIASTASGFMKTKKSKY
mgnify:CR=1 FL=1